ncbi:MAG: alpha-glucosidase/alpha-galactosidase [Candidatus Brocadiia bacterium]
MARAVSIAVIGAGSAQFSMGLVKDLCLTEGLAGSRVHLMDVDAERVEMVQSLARRYADELGVELTFTATTDREEALPGADFVLNTASVGAHGGGGFGSVHNLRFFLGVARDVERICPDAWLIQSGNPVFEGCTLMTRETGVKVLGLCHGHHGVYEMARVLGLEDAEEHLSWQASGFNHVIYLTHCYYKGEDVYPMLDRWIEEESEHCWATYEPGFGENQMSRAAITQYRMLGYMPIGDTPRAGGWWFHTSQQTKRQWFGPVGGFDSEEGWGQYIHWLEKQRTHMFEVARNPDARVTEEFPPEKTSEQIVPIIDALVNDNAGYFQVNIPNSGLIERIPGDVVVEVPAYVSKRGIQGVRVGQMPRSVMVQVLLPRLAQAEQRVEFARTPDPGLMLHMILYQHTRFSNRYTPPVGSYEEAEKRMENILRDDAELTRLLEQ